MLSFVRDTSLNAYDELRDSLVLGRQALKVLRTVGVGVELTDKEISVLSGLNINVVTARRNQLMKECFVVSFRKKECSITGSFVYAWKLTLKGREALEQ